jgi:dephospho-CoA kinase
MKKIIGITGMPGAGKGEFVKIAMKRGIPVIRMGDLVWNEVKNRKLALTPENVAKIADSERKKYGYDIWALRTLEAMKNLHAAIVIIDGIRGNMEIARYREEFGDKFVLVAVHASPRTRIRRITARMRADDTMTTETFESRDNRELTWGIGNAIAMADFMIINETTIEDFCAKVNSFLDTVILSIPQSEL